MPATTTAHSHAASVENILIGRMENINPAPRTFQESQDLGEFLDFAQQYVSIVEPSVMFTRRIIALLETIERARVQQQEQPRPRVQVTRIGARRVFADITHEVMQEENIAANLI
jgi:predicted RNA-binding Zn ribbon-like protein